MIYEQKLVLITADQLFKKHPALDNYDNFLMLESLDLAKKHNYHKFKLCYIYTTMREYADFLIKKGKTVHYYNLELQVEFENAISDLVLKYSFKTLVICEIANKYFTEFLQKICLKLGINLEILENPMFLTSKVEFQDYLQTKPNKQLLFHDFYKFQRKRLQILVDENHKPIGGSWSFDKENRQKLPKSILPTERNLDFQSRHWQSVCTTIENYFPENPGLIRENSWLPVNFHQAENFLSEFVNDCLMDFGKYEDALTSRSDTVFHSGLSALLNNGLLVPKQVLMAVLSVKQTPLNSLEGFIRQIIGWREWVKGLYDWVYPDNFLELNFFQATNNLPDYFYTCKIPDNQNLPLQISLDKVLRLAYCHHIERLMILANWMTLNEYSPAKCYTWFLEMFVDSAEWVMVANVMGMGLFADGGIFATKPYVAGGNYIKKMSDYKLDKNEHDWEKLWTDKFWNFILKNREFFSTNPRMKMLINKSQMPN